MNYYNIQPGYRNGIWLWKMCHTDDEKWEKRIRGRNRIVKSKMIGWLGFMVYQPLEVI